MTDRTRITLTDIYAAGEDEGDSLVIDINGNIVASGVTGGGSSLEIQEDDAQKVTDTSVINFEGDVTVTDEGAGKATVTISGGGGSLEVQENDVQKVTDVTILNFEGGAEVTDESGGKATITISGGTGGGAADFSIWMPDAPPASPSAYDDEFDDSSFDTGLWSAYDQGDDLNVGEDVRGLVLTSDGGATIAGVYQAVPASAGWSIIAKISSYGPQTYTVITGLMLLESVSNLNTTNMAIWGQTVGGQRYGWAYYTANDYNQNGQAEAHSDKDQPISTYYFRIRAVSTTWYLDFSLDGVGWMQKAAQARPWTPTGFGIGKRLDDNLHTSVVHFFRYTTDTSVDGIVYGDKVDKWRAT